MEYQDPEIIEEFVVESTEHLADIENQLLTIEAAGADIDADLVNTVFRGVHSIKGAAGFLGLTTTNELAHSLENVLNLMRERQLVPTSEIVDVMLRSADQLRDLVGDVEGSNDVDVSELVSALQVIASGDGAANPNEIATIPEVIEKQAEQQASSSNREEQSDGNVAASLAEADALIAAMEQEMLASRQDVANDTAAQQKSVEQAAKPSPSKAKDKQEGKKTSATQPKASTESNIRVSVESLDRLMNLAGELVLGRNQLLQSVSIGETDGLEAVAAKINQVTSEMQDAIMQTRMQPIGHVFTRFNRVVRDLSAKLGKQCQLVIEGNEVEVDKTIVEAITDPLTHLVRNAVDHGLELPEKRIANGKSSQGLLQLRAFHQSGKVCIEIADDGAGINTDTLKNKAIEKGLISNDQAESMSERDALRLILMPGFSTAEKLSDVSGRGVGMDVVRTNIEKLGGTVDIESQVGKGTTILVTLPLTLAIIPSLMIECNDDRYAIPQVNIAELVRLRGQEITKRLGRVNEAEVLRLRGTLLPLVRLSDVLGVRNKTSDEGESATDDPINIIVVETGQLRYGLIVDGLCDSEEIVVKPLGRHLTSCPCLSGATILGDGRAALILDVNSTAQQAKLRAISDGTATGDDSDCDRERGDTQSVLLFTNDPAEQFAVPMEIIARIERIESAQIVSVGNEELLHYRDSSLPLIRLENVASAKPAENLETLYVVVFEVAGREVGVIAGQLVDIRDVADQFDPSTFDDEVVVGSQVIDDRTTRLLDTMALARKARPDWFVATSTGAMNRSIAPAPANRKLGKTQQTDDTVESGAGNCILLAEDSSFFRRQVKGFLQDSGFAVVDCEDGREAWKTLEASPNRFQAVLTDIEMPNMDGLELTRRIRSENQFADLPIIALTSLASQEDFDRGYDAGVTEYQVKLDRDELIATVKRFATAESPEPVQAAN